VAIWIFILATLGALATARVAGRRDAAFFVPLFGAAFAVRVGAALALVYWIPTLVSPDHSFLSLGLLGDDGKLYHLLAMRAAEAWDAGRNPLAEFTYWRAASAYISLHSVVYKLAGPQVLMMSMVNACLGALVPVFVHGIARELLSPRRAKFIAVLVAFYPDQIVYSSGNLKDISITLAVAASVWALLRLQGGQGGQGGQATGGARLRAGGLLVVAAGYITLSRFYYVPLLVVALLVGRYTLSSRQNVRALAVRLVGVGVLAVSGLWLISTFSPALMLLLRDPVSGAAGWYSRLVQTEEGGMFSVLLQPPLNTLLLPLTMLVVLLLPLPVWAFFTGEPMHYVLLPGMLVWYALLPFVLYGMWSSRTHPAGRVLLVVTVGALVVLAMTGSGIVTTGRTRLPVQPLMLVQAGLGFVAFAQRRPALRGLTLGWTLAMSSALLMYVIVR
jgi:hypothetical protein